MCLYHPDINRIFSDLLSKEEYKKMSETPLSRDIQDAVTVVSDDVIAPFLKQRSCADTNSFQSSIDFDKRHCFAPRGRSVSRSAKSERPTSRVAVSTPRHGKISLMRESSANSRKVQAAVADKFVVSWKKTSQYKDTRQALDRHFWGPHDIPKEYVEELQASFKTICKNDCAVMWLGTDATELALQGWMEVFKNEIEEVVAVLDLVLKYITWILSANFSAKVTKAALEALSVLLERLAAMKYEWTEREIDITLPIFCERCGQSSPLTFVRNLYLKCMKMMITGMGERALPRLFKALCCKSKKSVEFVLNLCKDAIRDSEGINIGLVERYLIPIFDDSSSEIRKQAVQCMREVFNKADDETQIRLKKALKPQVVLQIMEKETGSGGITPRTSTPRGQRPRKSFGLQPEEHAEMSEEEVVKKFDSSQWIGVSREVVAVLEKSDLYNERILDRLIELLNAPMGVVEVQAAARVLGAVNFYEKTLSTKNRVHLMNTTLNIMQKKDQNGSFVLDCGETWKEFLHAQSRSMAERVADAGGPEVERQVCDYLLAVTKIREDFETVCKPVKRRGANDPLGDFFADCSVLHAPDRPTEDYIEALSRLGRQAKNVAEEMALVESFPGALKLAFDKQNNAIMPWALALMDVIEQSFCPEKYHMMQDPSIRNVLRDNLRQLLRTLYWVQVVYRSGENASWKIAADKVNLAVVSCLLTCARIDDSIFAYTLLLKFGLFEREKIGHSLVAKCIRKLNKQLKVDSMNVEKWCRLLRDFSDCIARSCIENVLVKDSITHASILYRELCNKNNTVGTTLLQMVTSLSPAGQVQLRRIFREGYNTPD